jgi:predicted esterase
MDLVIIEQHMHYLFRFIISAVLLCGLQAKEEILKDKQGMDCFVYLPDALDPAVTYQLVVGVHGAGGKGNGAAGLKDWAKRGDVIVIGPSFETKGERPYQNGDGIHAEKLIDLFETLKKSYKLRDRMFLHGFSGGCQFTHRFTMLHPKLVCGLSAHSGGSWATDGFGEISNAVKDIPFVISCGEKDTAKSFPEALYTRLEWYGRFAQEMEKRKFCYLGATWPNVGHSICEGAWDQMKQCFQITTGLPGASATEQVAISPNWKNLDPKLSKAPATTAPKPAADEAKRDALLQAAFQKAAAETVPDERLIAFMKQHPPLSWKGKEGAGKLLAQCERAALAWHQAAKSKGLWNEVNRQQFAEFTAGLDLKTE